MTHITEAPFDIIAAFLFRKSKYPPAKPGALVLLAPQRGKTGLRLKADITSQTSVDRNEHLPSLGF